MRIIRELVDLGLIERKVKEDGNRKSYPLCVVPLDEVMRWIRSHYRIENGWILFPSEEDEDRAPPFAHYSINDNS